MWWCASINPKATLIFPKNFFNFRSDTIKKQGFINLSSKSYSFVILSHFEVIFFRECSLLSILMCFVYTHRCTIVGCSLLSISLLSFVYTHHCTIVGCSLLSTSLLRFVYTHCCTIEVVCCQISLSSMLRDVFCEGL